MESQNTEPKAYFTEPITAFDNGGGAYIDSETWKFCGLAQPLDLANQMLSPGNLYALVSGKKVDSGGSCGGRWRRRPLGSCMSMLGSLPLPFLRMERQALTLGFLLYHN